MPHWSVTAARAASFVASGPVIVPSRPEKVTATPVTPPATSCSVTLLVRLFSILGMESASATR